jgi:hypothetical protein
MSNVCTSCNRIFGDQIFPKHIAVCGDFKDFKSANLNPSRSKTPITALKPPPTVSESDSAIDIDSLSSIEEFAPGVNQVDAERAQELSPSSPRTIFETSLNKPRQFYTPDITPTPRPVIARSPTPGKRSRSAGAFSRSLLRHKLKQNRFSHASRVSTPNTKRIPKKH